MLKEQLQKQIEQEGAEHESATPHEGVGTGIYSAGAYKYATLWQAAEEKAEKYEKALKAIANWQLPVTGQFWDDDKTQPMSYGACYGSNGERDYMKALATAALTLKTGEDEKG